MVEVVVGKSEEALNTGCNAGRVLRVRISIRGAVQGVGFRPFVYRLAKTMGLNGWVRNSSQGVSVEIEGERQALDEFVSRLERERPPRSSIHGMETAFLDPVGFRGFSIMESDPEGAKSAIVLPDIATCPECIAEIFDPANRRYLYPFTNCTNCGPRFSIIKGLPYDRPNTTMAGFEMCDECRAEYEDPSDRRFHAQPNACPKCGPHLELWDNTGKVREKFNGALLEAAEAIRGGKIVALKGIGGFQLLADARNDDAVERLRERKRREEKPFAVMYPSIELVRQGCKVSPLDERLLLSPESPIVLLTTESSSGFPTMNGLTPAVAPRNPYLGVMLPYTPLHHILMRGLGFPIVATSGNISDEPICIDEHEALSKLGDVADYFLVNDRPIVRNVDDSVVRIMAGRTQVVRRARGFAPFPLKLDLPAEESVLAVGAHLKNTIAVNCGNNVFVSQHIGDLSTAEAYHAFQRVNADFKNLYDVTPSVVAHDLHPDYLSTQFASKMSTERVRVQHHFAHVAACMAENRLEGQLLGVSWDGTGYGEDGNIWGGEFLLTDGNSYKRRASFRPFRLPGSHASVREPRRTALGLLYEVFGDDAFGMNNLAPIREFDTHTLSIFGKMLEAGLNSPLTTSAGRLFDAVSSILDIRQSVNFEGQGAMELEFAATGAGCEESYTFGVVPGSMDRVECRKTEVGKQRSEEENEVREDYTPWFIVDWEPLIRRIVAEVLSGIDVGKISAKFHNTLAEIVVDISKRVGEERVVLTGGCFQNKYLTERTVLRLNAEGFRPYWHQRVPPNDGGISLGQMFVALKRTSKRNVGIEERWNGGE